MTQIAVRRLRTSGTRSDAEALLRRALAETPDRSVLIVRRLSLVGDDPDAARHRLAQLRRTAARPTPGDDWTGPGSAEAVLFEDEAHLLACLTADLLAGSAAQRWYWRPRLVRAGTRPLSRAWLDSPRWVPAALAMLEHQRPDVAQAAVESLSGAELRAVAAAVVGVGLRPPRAFGALEPWRPAAAATPPETPAGAGQTTARTSTPDTRPVRQAVPTLDRDVPRAASPAAPDDVAPARHDASAAPQPSTATPSTGDGPDTSVADTWPALPAQPRGPEGAPRTRAAGVAPAVAPAAPPIRVVTAPVGPATDQGAAHREPPSVHRPPSAPPEARPGPVPAPPPKAVTRRRRLSDGPLLVESQLAGVCYLLPLLVRLSELPGPARPAPAWTELSAFGRRVLRGRLDVRRRADPLWAVLGGLAAGNHEASSSTRTAEPWWPEALDFLSRHEVDPGELTIPGGIGVTRTHVDVIFTLDQIDLRIRRAGLDQDPGWVPSLGRIVSFHFL